MAASTTAGSMPATPAADAMDPKRLIAFFAMVVGMFMAILDIQIVSASLAEIQAGLSAGSDEIGWVQTSYLIAEVIMIPLSGTLARIISTPIIGLIATLAPTIGPTVGGYLSHAFSWHWLFLVNIIPGIIVTLVTWNFIDFDKPEFSLFKKFDWWGLLSVGVFLVT